MAVWSLPLAVARCSSPLVRRRWSTLAARGRRRRMRRRCAPPMRRSGARRQRPRGPRAAGQARSSRRRPAAAAATGADAACARRHAAAARAAAAPPGTARAVRTAGARGTAVGLRIRLHLEDQVLGLVAHREPHAVGLHLGDDEPVDRLALQHAPGLAAGDLAQEGGALAVDDQRAGERELAALHRRLRRLGDDRRRRTAGRVEQRARDRFRPRGEAAVDREVRQHRHRHGLGDDRLDRLRHRGERAAPVGLPAEERDGHGQRHQPPSSAHGSAATRVMAQTPPFFAGSANANADTSSCTLISGSCPGAGRKPRKAFNGRSVRLSTVRYGCCVSMALRIFCRFGVVAKNWTVTTICLNRPSSRGLWFWLVEIRPPLPSIAAAHLLLQFRGREVGRGVPEVEPARVAFLHRRERLPVLGRLRGDAPVGGEPLRQRLERVVVVLVQEHDRQQHHGQHGGDREEQQRPAPARAGGERTGGRARRS